MMLQMQESRLLTAADVARQLQVSKAFAYSLMKRGELACVRLGRAVRVRPDDLDRYIASKVSEVPSMMPSNCDNQVNE